MTKEELNKLQRYIGKRSQGQNAEQVIAHIEKINKKAPLTDEEWEKLLFPVCANADVVIFKFLLEKVQRISNVEEYIIHTLRFRNISTGYEQKQIEILEMLFDYVEECDRERILNNALVNAAWFGEYEAVKFLVEAGADIRFVDSKGRNILELAQNAVEKFGDLRVHDYVSERL